MANDEIKKIGSFNTEDIARAEAKDFGSSTNVRTNVQRNPRTGKFDVFAQSRAESPPEVRAERRATQRAEVGSRRAERREKVLGALERTGGVLARGGARAGSFIARKVKEKASEPKSQGRRLAKRGSRGRGGGGFGGQDRPSGRGSSGPDAPFDIPAFGVGVGGFDIGGYMGSSGGSKSRRTRSGYAFLDNAFGPPKRQTASRRRKGGRKRGGGGGNGGFPGMPPMPRF